MVAIIAGIRNFVIQIPLIRPTTAANTHDTRIPTIAPYWSGIIPALSSFPPISAVRTPAVATEDGTDRSSSPHTIVSVIPNATIPCSEIFLRIFMILFTFRKCGDKNDIKTIITTITTSSIYGSINFDIFFDDFSIALLLSHTHSIQIFHRHLLWIYLFRYLSISHNQNPVTRLQKFFQFR